MTQSILGQGTRALLLRSLCLYVLLFLTGLALALLTPWPALGLGLIFPGGGFVHWVAGDGWHYIIHLLLPAIAFAAFMASLLLWFATGNALAPPVTWLALAVTASLMHHQQSWADAKYVVPCFAVVFLGLTTLVFKLRLMLGAKLRGSLPAKINVELPRLERSRRTSREFNELSLEQLQLFRTLFDRALQPIEKFDGFNHLDQYQTAALRYQLNVAGYALSMFQYNYAPAFKGYLHQAQHNLVAKNLNYCIWKFWQRENLWGNLDTNPDPCGRDNIMFTGFLATQIAMFHAVSGETPFNNTASLSFKHSSGRIFEHDAATLSRSLLNNFSSARLGLMACEPNWVYPLCNTIGAAALAHFVPTDWAVIRDGFAHSLMTEFLDPSGNFVPCRSAYTGLALPTIGGAVGQTFPCFFLNATLPDLAEQHWLANRGRMIKNGKLKNAHFWPVDVGNYGFSRASSYAASAAAAKEIGDYEIANILLEALNEECPATLKNGVRHRSAASFWAHSVEALAISTRRNSLQSLITNVKSKGPQLDELIYPDVLVASAYQKGDGLEAVLYPGSGAKTVQIGLTGLRPSANYIANETKVISNAEGFARFNIELSQRKLLQVRKVI
jgi:hypothetical protein